MPEIAETKEQLLEQISRLNAVISKAQTDKKELRALLKPILDEERVKKAAQKPITFKEYKKMHGLVGVWEMLDILWKQDFDIDYYKLQHEIKTNRLKATKHGKRWLSTKEDLQTFIDEQGKYYKSVESKSAST